MIPWIDSHTHMNIISSNLEEQFSLLQEYQDNHIVALINVSTHIDCYRQSKQLNLKKLNYTFITSGIHPSYATNIYPKWREDIKNQLNEGLSVAVGECGLDYLKYNTQGQKELFETQIQLSIEYNLPLIIHTRDAFDDMYNILKQYPKAYGVLHCYSGSADLAKRYLDLGYYLSFSGNVTFKNATMIQESCRITPLNRMLIETDAPFLSPMPIRGKSNSPKHIVHTAQFIAKLKETSLEQISHHTCYNTNILFRLNSTKKTS